MKILKKTWNWRNSHCLKVINLKSNAMLITVGTGIGGKKEATDSLAHGLLKSIENFRPTKVVFFGSENSVDTINSLKDQYLEIYGEPFEIGEFIEIDDIDSFKKYFTAIKSKIVELEDDYNIIIDYTSGTKTMTMSAAFASMVYRKRLVFVSGERVNGIVVKGTEEINSQNLYLVYDDLMITKIKELFNSNRFEAGKVLVEDITNTNENKDVYTQLFEAYSAFDCVDYVSALETFDVKEFCIKWPELERNFQMNAKALNIINMEKHGLKCYYVLASMLNNARRRAEENKFDDAIARLYRALELIAQIRLKDYEISTSNVDDKLLDGKVSDDYLYELRLTRDKNSQRIKIGLTQDYALLNELGDDLGEFYKNNEKLIQNSLKYRNNSILAHGLESQNQQQYEEFKSIVLNAAKVLKSDIDNFISETIFPEFEI